jgi:L-ribulose-5-phosphate 3-epimerase
VIAFMTANYVAEHTGYEMRDGWGQGDRATNDYFRPVETYEARLDELLGRARALGVDTVDLWGAHLSPDWATEDHVAIAREVLSRHDLGVATSATWVGPSNAERACELALAIGTSVIGAGMSGDPARVAAVLREHGVRLAIENHPERTPDEVLATIDRGDGAFGATVDTGWWATQGYDAVQAIEELGEHVLHVHLKDVLRRGEPHETCRWGDGVVPIEGCVRALQRLGYRGYYTVEHEPELYDPTDDCREMIASLRSWLA